MELGKISTLAFNRMKQREFLWRHCNICSPTVM